MVMVEILTGMQRRGLCSAEQKKAMVLEAEQPVMNISLVSRKYELHPNQLFRWRRQLHEGALATGHEGDLVASRTAGLHTAYVKLPEEDNMAESFEEPADYNFDIEALDFEGLCPKLRV